MKFLRLLPLLALTTPAIVLAAAPQNFRDLASLFATILNSATTVLIVAGLAIYFWGISINILKFGEGEAEKVRAYFVWGIIVLFLMVSIWGIIGLAQDTLFSNDQLNPPTGANASPSTFNPPQINE